MSDALLLLLLLRLNLAAGVAIALAMLLRRPVRRAFGPRVAYGLWTLAPLFAGAMLLPARVVTVTAPARPAQTLTAIANELGAPPQAGFDASQFALALWIAGALATIAWLAWSQIQFGRAVRAGRAGPAVVGILKPRIVVPDDFADRYTPREQLVVIAHEETHIARQDSRINALVSLARCLAWFNPLAHLMARELRIDQEFACDAQVVAAHPAARRSYAEAMLKTQLAGRPLPLGCYWPAQSAHPLAERIALLSRKAPGRMGRGVGGALVMLIALGGALAAWAARPPQVVLRPQVTAAAWPRKDAAPLRPAAAPRAATVERVAGPERSSTAPMIEVIDARATEPPPAPPAATDDRAPFDSRRRLLPPGLFGPARIRGLASWSSVAPGFAVRVLATMVDPDGVPLTTDLTAFGSQSRYRLGYIERHDSRYKLFTVVKQHGDRLQVTASLNRAFEPSTQGSIDLAPGETGVIRLPSGPAVTVTPTLRPETPEEVAEGSGRGRIDVLRTLRPA